MQIVTIITLFDFALFELSPEWPCCYKHGLFGSREAWKRNYYNFEENIKVTISNNQTIWLIGMGKGSAFLTTHAICTHELMD